MIKAVIDNNVIIDALNPNPQFEFEAQQILRYASAEVTDGFISANSLTDIFTFYAKSTEPTRQKLFCKS